MLYKVLSGFGHDKINDILKENIQDAELSVLSPITINNFYDKVEDGYDVIILRDSAIDYVKLNIMSIVKELEGRFLKTKFIFILENSYGSVIDKFIENREKTSKDFIFLRDTNIENLIKTVNTCINNIKESDITKIEEEDSDDIVFNLSSMEEKIEPIKDFVEKTNKKSIISKESKKVFPLNECTIDLDTNLVLYLNAQKLNSQMAIQLANKEAKKRKVLYIDYISNNNEFINKITNINLTVITQDDEPSIDNILQLMMKYRDEEDTLCIVNAEYNKRLLGLSLMGDIYIEILQDEQMIQMISADTMNIPSSLHIHYLVSYFDHLLVPIKEIIGHLGDDIIVMNNTRHIEYISRKNGTLFMESGGVV